MPSVNEQIFKKYENDESRLYSQKVINKNPQS